MANRFARSAGAVSPFNPKVPVADGLPEVRRATGEDSQALADMGNSLSDVFGRIADREARIEGAREGAIAGNDPAFRPKGATTIRGEAFEKAATASYLDNLDAKMRVGLTEAYMANKDNPAGLKAALDGFKAGLLENDTFDEIKGAVNANFERLSLTFRTQAANALEAKVQDRARASNREVAVKFEGTATNTIESNPNDPEAKKIALAEMEKANAADQRGVAAGWLSAEQAAENKIRRNRELETRQFGAQISTAPPEKLPEMKRVWQERKAKGLTPADAKITDTVENAFYKREEQLATAGRQIDKEVAHSTTDMLSRAEKGWTPSPDEIARTRQVALLAPNGAATVAEFDRRMGAVETAKVRGAEAVEAQARELRARVGPTPAKVDGDHIQYLYDLAATTRKSVRDNPIERADRQGIARVEPLNLTDPQALAEGISKRAALAAALPKDQNPTGKMLQVEDVKQLNAIVEKGGEPALATLEALVRGAGKDTPKLMAQIGGTAPQLAQAGNILHAGNRQAARDALAGIAARKVDGLTPMEPDSQVFRSIWKGIVGDSMASNPDDRDRIEATARAIAVSRMRNLKENKGTDAQEIYTQAIQDAFLANKSGGSMTGGVAKVRPGWVSTYPVVVPPDVRNDRFMDAIGAIRDGDLPTLSAPPAAGFSAAQIRQAVPIAVSGGYRFALGEPNSKDPKYITDVNGGIFTLRWSDIRGRLRERVPGAFDGGTP